MPGIEPFNLVHARAGVLGQRVDIDLALAQRQSHTYRRVPERIERVAVFKQRIGFQITALE